MKTLWIMAAGLFTLVGCSQSECEIALESIQERARSCQVPNAEFFDDYVEDKARACEAADRDVLQRQASCTEAASCEALDGSDTAGNRAYTSCIHQP